jgi:hypothetical protein
MNAIKDLNLDDVVDELRRRARHAGGGHDTTTLFSVFTIGILAGAVVGAAIALLITPLSGRQARTKLSEKVDKLRADKVTWDEAPVASGNGKATGSYEPDYRTPKPVS